MTDRIIEGLILTIAGDIGADEILPPQHAASMDPAVLATHCFAARPDLAKISAGGGYRILVCSGLFGTGLVRPQVPAALAGAGFRIVLAPHFSPLFVENALNGGHLLPLVARLEAPPESGSIGRVTLHADGALVEITGVATVWPHRLPDWTLAGKRWIDVVQARADEAGGLPELQSRIARKA